MLGTDRVLERGATFGEALLEPFGGKRERRVLIA
jgi:hypothetical protein